MLKPFRKMNYIGLKRIVLFFRVFSMVIFLALFLNTSTKAQTNEFIQEDTNFTIDLLDRNSGLSNLSVSSILQDKDGFIWFGTQSGLNRYDGQNMMVIKKKPFSENTLTHNLIQTMYYDFSQHVIWIGTYQGISRYDIAKDQFENYTVEDYNLSNSVVIAIEKDVNGNMWFGTLEGLNKLDADTGQIVQYTIPGDTVRSLLIDSTGRLLVGTYSGVYYYDISLNEIIPIDIDLPSLLVMTIDEFVKGRLSFGLWDGGLFEIDLDFDPLSQSLTTYEDNRIYAVNQTNDGTYWIGTWGGGLFFQSKESSGSYLEKDGLSHPVIYSLFEDDENILWIGTNGGGVHKINPRKRSYLRYINNPDDENSIDKGKINAIYIDTNGDCWFAIYNKGLNHYNPKSNTWIKYTNDPENPNSIQGNQVMDILELPDNKLLLSTDEGLIKFDKASEKFELWPILEPGTRVYDVEKIGEHDYWIGTYTQGVIHYNDQTLDQEKFFYEDENNKTLTDDLVFKIFYDSKERLWVATNNGLNMLEKGSDQFKYYVKESNERNQLAGNAIEVIYEDSLGRVWFGLSDSGIAYYKEETNDFISYTEADGLASNSVVSIIEKNENEIWVATTDGISILDPITNEIINLTPEDGIGGWEFNRGIFKDQQGNIWFGGIHGIIAIPPTLARYTLLPPRVYITKVTLFNEPIPNKQVYYNGSVLKFKSNESAIGFEFIGLDFDASDKTSYAYKLSGIDEDWVYVNNMREVVYGNLPSGHYIFSVVAQGIRSSLSEPVTIEFTIAKPWYSTIYAYILYVLIAMSLLFLVSKLVQAKKLDSKNSELLILNDKLEEANESLANLSIKDSLTGLYNRRYFNTKIEEQLNLAIRSEANIALIMIDIDNFKDINDTYGHLSGDRYLIEFTDLLKKVLHRRTDMVARYGGDEFVAMLFDNDIEGAKRICEKIRDEVRVLKVEVEYEEEPILTTVSIGMISMVPDEMVTGVDLIRSADAALYAVKNKGRNDFGIGSIIDRHGGSNGKII